MNKYTESHSISDGALREFRRQSRALPTAATLPVMPSVHVHRTTNAAPELVARDADDLGAAILAQCRALGGERPTVANNQDLGAAILAGCKRLAEEQRTAARAQGLYVP